MNSKRETIMQALFAKLQGITPTIPVFRSRLSAVSELDGTTIILAPESESIDQIWVPYVDRRLIVSIHVIAFGAVPDYQADAYIVSVHDALMSDLSLGGLAMSIEEQKTEWQMIAAGIDGVMASISYDILYRTQQTKLES